MLGAGDSAKELKQRLNVACHNQPSACLGQCAPSAKRHDAASYPGSIASASNTATLCVGSTRSCQALRGIQAYLPDMQAHVAQEASIAKLPR